VARNRSPIAGEEGFFPALNFNGSDLSEGSVQVRHLPSVSRAELLASFSEGLDLAEGRQLGHAKRVCYIAMSLARSLGLTEDEQAVIYYAGLLHDIGVPLVSPELSDIVGVNETTLFAASPRKLPEELATECCLNHINEVVNAFHQHCRLGGEQAIELRLSAEVGEAIASNHEHWDGSGFPEGLAAHDIPLAARIVTLADWADSLIACEQNSLLARRNLLPEIEGISEIVLDPRLVEQIKVLSQDDQFWLGLFAGDLWCSLLAMKPHENGKSGWKTFVRLSGQFARIIDSKSRYPEGKSRRVAQVSAQLGEAIGLSPDHVAMIRLAATLQDIGQLGVPARIMAKPDLLTLTEMQLLQKHPSYTRLILENILGLEDMALWVGAHHERPDGKGYPEMLMMELIPLESRILAVANVYVALTSDRPYRKALNAKEALKVLRGAAGTQLDPHLMQVFASLF